MAKNILNIPKICKLIREKHNEFISNVGSLPDKISADKRLEEERVAAKVEAILDCFKREKIIDKVVIEEVPNKLFILIKNGLNEYVGISVKERNITIPDFSRNSRGSAFPLKEIKDIDVDTYDWVGFAGELLDYIHSSIYSRKEAIQTKIFKD